MSDPTTTVAGETATLAVKRSVMNDDELAVFAVLGDPAGNRYVQAPQTQAEMSELHMAALARREDFFCSRRLGGCGEKVMVVNGPVRRPHFRHYAHTDCPLTRAAARDIYTHAIIQDALVSFMQAHGYLDAVAEKRLDARSRVDVHCSPGAVIEVQLSGETDTSMLARTLRYGNNVTWLYDPVNPISSRDSTLTRDGIVLIVRIRPVDAFGWKPQTEFSRQPTDIGVKHKKFPTDGASSQWWPLEQCTFTPVQGLQPPGYAAIRQGIADARLAEKEQAAEAQRVANQAEADAQKARNEIAAASAARQGQFMEELAGRRRKADLESAARRARNLADRGESTSLGTRPSNFPVVFTVDDLAVWEAQYGLVAPEHGAWRRVLEHHDGPFADWVALMTDGWVTGLPEHLIDPAWAALYLTTMSLSGQVSVFLGGGDQDFDPNHPYDPIDSEGLILQRLVNLSLVSLYGGPGEPLMLKVQHHLGEIRWNARIRQPAVWAPATP